MELLDPVNAPSDDAGRHAALLEYDFLKHLTTLGLTAVGVIVTLAGTVFTGTADRDRLWVGAGLFLAGAVLAFMALDGIVRDARAGKLPGRAASRYRYLAVATMGMGVGVVLSFAHSALG
jgi:hypothetical protein